MTPRRTNVKRLELANVDNYVDRMLRTVENPIVPKLRISIANSEVSDTEETLRLGRSPVIEPVSETKESDEADSSASDGEKTIISKKSSVLASIKNEILLSPLRDFKSNELTKESPLHQRHKSMFCNLIKYNAQSNIVETTLPNIQHLESMRKEELKRADGQTNLVKGEL